LRRYTLPAINIPRKFHFSLSYQISPSILAMATQARPLPLRVIEEVLNFIRGNLQNVESSWGKDSPQYRSAVQLMDEWLNDHVKQLNLEKSDLDELMQKMSLNDPKK